jgi:GNAT superfamily N-acetyltransferase
MPPQEIGVRISAILGQYEAGVLQLGGIFQAKYERKIVGALYSQCRPDGSVMLWVPSMTSGFSSAPFYEPLEKFCRSQEAFAAVALADNNQPFDEETFCTAGQFEFLSDLVYLVSSVSQDEKIDEKTGEKPAKGGRLRFVPISDCSADPPERLVNLVSATYRQSLDFPKLMQIASVDDVLYGYRIGALFRPELWFYIQHEGKDIGVLFLTDQSSEQFELTYMGLLEEARGNGFSKEIVQFAQSVASQWKRSLLLTSVDEKNIPACQSYLAHGFQAWDRKKVFARFFPK